MRLLKCSQFQMPRKSPSPRGQTNARTLVCRRKIGIGLFYTSPDFLSRLSEQSCKCYQQIFEQRLSTPWTVSPKSAETHTSPFDFSVATSKHPGRDVRVSSRDERIWDISVQFLPSEQAIDLLHGNFILHVPTSRDPGRCKKRPDTIHHQK